MEKSRSLGVPWVQLCYQRNLALRIPIREPPKSKIKKQDEHVPSFWYILQNHFERGCCWLTSSSNMPCERSGHLSLRGQAFWWHLVAEPLSSHRTFADLVAKAPAYVHVLSPNTQAWLRVQRSAWILEDDPKCYLPGKWVLLLPMDLSLSWSGALESVWMSYYLKALTWRLLEAGSVKLSVTKGESRRRLGRRTNWEFGINRYTVVYKINKQQGPIV